MAVSVLATAGYYVMPDGYALRHWTYAAMNLIDGLVMLAGIRIHRPRHKATWLWLAGAQFSTVAGDVLVLTLLAGQQQAYPSIADVFYLAAYPMVLVALVLMLKARTGRDTAALIDAAMVTTAMALAFWVLVVRPAAADGDASAADRLIAIVYPAVDLLILALMSRLYVSGSGRVSVSNRLLALAAVLMLAGDVIFSVFLLHGGYTEQSSTLWLLAYLMMGAAALHPSMRGPSTNPLVRSTESVRPVRLVLLSGSSLLVPALLFVPGIWRHEADRLVVACGAVVLILLVMARLNGFVRQVRRQSDQLESLAMRDDLTGLANRRRLEQELRAAIEAGGIPQLALLGLNNFKTINDELGHVAGDELLVELAGRLCAASGKDALVARMSGDEFAVLMVNATISEADAIARKLSEQLREPLHTEDHELLVNAGIGLSDARGVDAAQTLRRAGVAMYVAKTSGMPARRWSPMLDDRSAEHARLGAEIRTALDTGQFSVVYQPIVKLPEGRVGSVEALVRWQHPQRGMISPVQFVPVAEQNGLIVELGLFILRTACEKLAGWREDMGADAPERVSVNVSAKQLARPGFAESVRATLAATGLPPECLTVEVTETAVFEGGQAVTALHELRAIGVRIALDDFGTGHSSLGLLQTVPVDALKVDKSFVDRVTEAGRHAVIAEALIQVATGLGLSAVAEGVETEEQANALYELGYRLLQGYHYGRPAADPDFEAARAIVRA